MADEWEKEKELLDAIFGNDEKSKRQALQMHIEFKRFEEEVALLPTVERMVITRLYGLLDGKTRTAEEVSKDLGITVDLVNRKEKMGLRSLKSQAEKLLFPI